MNDAHLHLLINHFPIIGTIIGLLILIAGLILKNDTLKKTAFTIFIFTAIFAAFSMATGEGAEEMVEDFPGIGHEIIHEHEEIAEKLAVTSYLLGVASLLGWFFIMRRKSIADIVSYIVLLLALITSFLAQQTGTTGGKIRHTEIRPYSTIEKEELSKRLYGLKTNYSNHRD